MSDPERVNILLVDDQPARLLSYEAILRELGQNLVQARSGTAALQCLMEEEFAVILLDVNMPDMDGFETATLIHQHPRFESTPIIFVTAVHVTDLDRLKGYTLGAVDYIYVPVIPEILRSKVSVLVELYCQRRELKRLNQNLEQANAQLAATNVSLLAEKQRELERLNATLETANRALEAEVAERRRAEAALREADRHKDEFLAILAHELRNPLAPLRNAVHIMRAVGIDHPQLNASRDIMDRQVDHLARLVDDLLDVSRITRGQIRLQTAPVDVANVVASAVEMNRPSIEKRQHRLSVDIPAEPIWVEGDATRLAQIVANLLSNAAKYTPNGNEIWLQVGEESRGGMSCTATIRIRDTGVGISPEMLGRIFDLFTQEQRTVESAQGGLGIGLALVRHLVELHGGTIEARSAGIDRGSEFIVRLPKLVLAVSPAKARKDLAVVSNKMSRGLRILVADDNDDSATTLTELLRMHGHVVQTARDGRQAVEMMGTSRPEVVLLDLGMPNLDGYEVARWIRGQVWGKGLALFALTGRGQEKDRLQTRQAGFDAHIVKPVKLDKLMDLLASVRPSPAGGNELA